MKNMTIREMATRYWVRCRQTGDNIEWFDTFEEAQADLEKYEAEDKKDEIYEEDFYEIYEEEPSDADIIFTLKHLTSRDGLTAEADKMIAETEYDLLVELFADKTVAEINAEANEIPQMDKNEIIVKQWKDEGGFVNCYQDGRHELFLEDESVYFDWIAEEGIDDTIESQKEFCRRALKECASFSNDEINELLAW